MFNTTIFSKTARCIILAVALLLAWDCSRRPEAAALDRAESLMEEHPDSALALLDAIDGSSLAGEVQARHALLLSQALDKNYIDVTDDSLINIAVGYYEKEKSFKEMISLYYRATVYFNSSNNDKAVMDATHAYELACQINDSYWIAKSAERIADLFYRTYNNDECIRFRKIALSYYSDTNDNESVDWARLCLAVAYSTKNEYEKAIGIIDSIMPEKCYTLSDSIFKSHCIQSLFHLYVDSGNFESAKTYFHRLQQFKTLPLSAADYGDMGYAEVCLGNLVKGKEYIDTAYLIANANNEQEILAADIALWEYLKQAGDKSDVINFTEKLINTQNKVAKETTRQGALAAQRNYYNSNFIAAKESELRVWRYLILCIVVAALIITIALSFMRLKIKLKNKDLELKAIEIAHLTSKIQEREKSDIFKDTQSENEKLHRIIDRLLAEWFRPINSLFDDFYENGDSSVAKSTMFNQVKYELGKITSNKSMLEIKKLVDDSLGGALTRFRNEVSDISDKDITFIALNIAGLSPRAICLFLDIKVKTVYSKRKRIKDKILASEITNKEFFINHLS